MRHFLGLLIFAMVLFIGAEGAMAGANRHLATEVPFCPEPGEAPEDCPWAKTARLMLQSQNKGQDTLAKLLKTEVPQLVAELRADSKQQAWKHLWGRSINFDEYAKAEIVDARILATLAHLFDVHQPMRTANAQASTQKRETPPSTDPAGHALVHAGMEHTYGYLFSLLKTPYGFKRARWVQGEIDRGFKLPPNTLSPNTTEGTLFSNLTYFIGHIAFRGDTKRLAILQNGKSGIAKSLADFDYKDLPIKRLEEVVEAKDSTGDVRKVTLRTDFVAFLSKPPTSEGPPKNSLLLIYSVVDPSRGGASLITAFPVTQGFVDGALKPEDLGENKPIKTRYNAFVEGVTGVAGLTGQRKAL